MAVEYLFLKIKQDIMLRASGFSTEATELIQQGAILEAETKLNAAKVELTRISRADQILISLLEQLSEAGIDQPSTTLFETLRQALLSEPATIDIPVLPGRHPFSLDRIEGRTPSPSPITSLENPTAFTPLYNQAKKPVEKSLELKSHLLEQELEDQFKNSPRYQEIIQQLSQPQIQINQLTDLQKIRASLAGIVFEEIGYLHLLNQESDDNTIILSPQETLTLYEKLFTGRRKKLNLDGFGLIFTLRGVTVPDGLIIKTSDGFLSVDTAVEYKSSSKDLSENTAFHDQLKKYTATALLTDLHRKNLEKGDFLKNSLRSLRPDLPDLPTSVKKDSVPLICVPSNSVSLINSKLGLDFEAIPFSTPSLTRLLNSILTEASLSYKIPTISTK